MSSEHVMAAPGPPSRPCCPFLHNGLRITWKYAGRPGATNQMPLGHGVRGLAPWWGPREAIYELGHQAEDHRPDPLPAVFPLSCLGGVGLPVQGGSPLPCSILVTDETPEHDCGSLGFRMTASPPGWAAPPLCPSVSLGLGAEARGSARRLAVLRGAW